jgi:hypothetical protein
MAGGTGHVNGNSLKKDGVPSLEDTAKALVQWLVNNLKRFKPSGIGSAFASIMAVVFLAGGVVGFGANK